MIARITNKIAKSDPRTRSMAKNAFLSLLMKAANILASMAVVPMTINYVNPTQYGIWLTLSSVIGWIVFFDLGICNGFRNKFAEAKAKGDDDLCRQYVSTSYFVIGCIVIGLITCLQISNFFINWSSILNVGASYEEELRKIFSVVSLFTCCNMVANVFSAMLNADQKPGIVSVIQAVGQYFSLIAIYILTITTEGSLLNLALYYSGVPFMVLFAVSILTYRFSSRYRRYAPCLSCINIKLIPNIMTKGIQFFVIYLCQIAVIQIVNVVISREIGPLAVTQYNIANKYFSVLFMVALIIINPVWSACSDAYAKKDIRWIESTVRRMEKLMVVSFVALSVMLAVSPVVYSLWIGNSVDVEFSLSIAMAIMVGVKIFSNIYMYMINGTGCVRVQLVIYILFAVVAWPSFELLAKSYGVLGILAFPSLVYVFQGIVGRIQIFKIIDRLKGKQIARGWLR